MSAMTLALRATKPLVYVKNPKVRVESRPTVQRLPGEEQRRAWALDNPSARRQHHGVTNWQFRAVCSHCDWQTAPVTGQKASIVEQARWHRAAHRNGIIPGEQDLWGELLGEAAA